MIATLRRLARATWLAHGSLPHEPQAEYPKRTKYPTEYPTRTKVKAEAHHAIGDNSQ